MKDHGTVNLPPSQTTGPARWPDETGRYEVFISEFGNWHVTWQGIHFLTTYKLSWAIGAARDHEAAVRRVEQAIEDGTPLPPPATKYSGRYRPCPPRSNGPSTRGDGNPRPCNEGTGSRPSRSPFDFAPPLVGQTIGTYSFINNAVDPPRANAGMPQGPTPSPPALTRRQAQSHGIAVNVTWGGRPWRGKRDGVNLHRAKPVKWRCMHEPSPWREFTSKERAALKEGDPVAVRLPGENDVRAATFLSWFRWGTKIRFEGETEPSFVGPFSLGPCS